MFGLVDMQLQDQISQMKKMLGIKVAKKPKRDGEKSPGSPQKKTEKKQSLERKQTIQAEKKQTQNTEKSVENKMAVNLMKLLKLN